LQGTFGDIDSAMAFTTCLVSVIGSVLLQSTGTQSTWPLSVWKVHCSDEDDNQLKHQQMAAIMCTPQADAYGLGCIAASLVFNMLLSPDPYDGTPVRMPHRGLHATLCRAPALQSAQLHSDRS
jgi:hypothetical protein